MHLGALQKVSIVYLDKIEPNRSVCMSSKIGTSSPVYCTAMGKAMLAFQSEQTIEETMAKMHFARYTPKAPCSPETLLKYLERVRCRGYSIDDEEIEFGTRCIGAPIFDEGHRVVAAVSVSGTSSRITAQKRAANCGTPAALLPRYLRVARQDTKKKGHLAPSSLRH
ncbi:MAG: IclR family transcriptional regulator, regulon repressor [Acidobacteriaceae bacterium]|nr:IclR family transcriptional regulator, regulon repressor [Acidobacteriaceae bacterium]